MITGLPLGNKKNFY